MSTTAHLTSDPTAVKRVIWGTNVDVQESMNMFKDFIGGFTKAHLVQYLQETGKEEDAMMVGSDSTLFYDHYLAEVIILPLLWL
jgi:DNA replication licensing factor MCM4